MAHDDDALWAGLDRPGDELAATSARARSRRRWLQQLAAESSTLAGVLLTLAEHDEAVTVHCGPWSHRGHLHRVGAGTCVIETPSGAVLLATEAVTAVESPREVADDRTPPEGPDLAGTLAALAPQHPAVALQLLDGRELAGTLVDLGKDVARIRLPSSVATVRLSAIACCVLPGTG